MFNAQTLVINRWIAAVLACAFLATGADAGRGGGGGPAGRAPAGARPMPATARPAPAHPAPGPRVAGDSARRPAVVRTAPAPAAVRRPPPPGPHARTLPPVMRPVRYGTAVRSLAGFHPLVVRDLRFAILDGVYYLAPPGADRYIVVRPPVGVVVPSLPAEYLIATVNDLEYYFYDDTWYDTSLQVIEVPVGGFIVNLPSEYEVVVIDGVRYYRVGELYYRETSRDGRPVYERVEVVNGGDDQVRSTSDVVHDSRGCRITYAESLESSDKTK